MTRGDDPFAVVHADDDLLVVAKPPGLLSYPPTGRRERNLKDLLEDRERRASRHCFAVHRLDRDTSGLMIFARTEMAKNALERAFRDGLVEKTYLAIVNGGPRGSSGTKKSFITDHGATATSSQRPDRGGKTAITEWRILERFANAALLEAMPRTGRFNQIRLHCVDLGCPIVGERKYAIAKRLPLRGKRVMLHAWRLAFEHPRSGERVEFVADPPRDFESLLATLRA
jgi:23S rRNA pseudouridine1911/1915/1917 synthase